MMKAPNKDPAAVVANTEFAKRGATAEEVAQVVARNKASAPGAAGFDPMKAIAEARQAHEKATAEILRAQAAANAPVAAAAAAARKALEEAEQREAEVAAAREAVAKALEPRSLLLRLEALEARVLILESEAAHD